MTIKINITEKHDVTNALVADRLIFLL